MARFTNYELERFIAQARPDAARAVEKERFEAERKARAEIIRMKRLMRRERLRGDARRLKGPNLLRQPPTPAQLPPLRL
jgi:hypothetical protein